MFLIINDRSVSNCAPVKGHAPLIFCHLILVDVPVANSALMAT